MNQWSALKSQLAVASNVAAGAMGNAVNSAQGALANTDLSSTSSKLSKGFYNISQTIRERGGNADVTELPQGRFFSLHSKSIRASLV